jgi:hypothetical protein
MNNSNSDLVNFLQSVITDIQNKNISNEQILYLTKFYINYKNTSSSKKDDKNIDSKLTTFDLLSAGSLFYSTLCGSLDINYKIEDEDEIKN